MRHDKINKTIYYNDAVVKIFDIPIFYTPVLSHPDPSVDRRSGLPPAFSDSRNLGTGLKLPYFWAIDNDKDFTFTLKYLLQKIHYTLENIDKSLKILI